MKTQKTNKTGARLYNLCQMFCDGLVIYGILCASLYIYYLCGADYEMDVVLRLIYVPFIVIFINAFARLYGGNVFYPGVGISRVEELKRLIISIFCAYIILFAYLGITRTFHQYSRLALLISFAASLLLLPYLRNFFRYLCWKYKLFRKPILIAGAGPAGRELAASLSRDWYFNAEVAGFLDDTETGEDIIGKLSDYRKAAEKTGVSYLAVCLPLEIQKKWHREFLTSFSHLLLIPEEGLTSICGSYPVAVGDRWGFEISNHLRMRLFCWEKVLAEVLIACVVLPLILPLCLVIAVLIKLTSPGPVLYHAKRLGINGKTIKVLKFRTMHKNAEAILKKMLDENPELKAEWEERFKLKNDPRITWLGNILRKTSLDELPQFFNVLRGEMAIIGPRPIVEDEISYYGEDFAVFSMVKPGITGLWQISGRSDVSYDSRVKLDVYYVSNWSIWLDCYIFLYTPIAVLMRKGAE